MHSMRELTIDEIDSVSGGYAPPECADAMRNGAFIGAGLGAVGGFVFAGGPMGGFVFGSVGLIAGADVGFWGCMGYMTIRRVF